MKIVVLTRSYGTIAIGGLPIVCKALCEGLAKLGVDVTLLTMAHPKSIIKETVNGVKIEYLGCPSFRYTEQWYFMATERVRELKPDLIYSESAAGHEVIGNFCNTPSVQRLHGFSFEEALTVLYNRFYKGETLDEYSVSLINSKLTTAFADHKYAQLYDVLIGITPDAVSNIASILRPRNVVCIPNGINSVLFKPDSSALKEYHWIYVGHVRTDKGIRLLIEATAKSAFRMRGLVVGAGPELDKIAEMAKGLDVDITFVGQKENEDLPAYYNKARFFINPSTHYTGFDTTIMEALLCGLPAIVTIGHNTSNDIDGKNIIGVSRGSAEGLTEVMDGMLSRKEMPSLESVRKFAGKYSTDNMVGKHIELFSDWIILKNRRVL